MSSGVVEWLGQRLGDRVEFAELVGVSEARMSQLAGEGLFVEGQSALAWLRGYIDRLREAGAGRDNDGTLAKERAQLARAQRIGQEIKNAVAHGEYAPVGLLGDMLGLASAAVAERMDSLTPRLKLVWPDMPDAARAAIEATVTTARNDWADATRDLVNNRLAEIDGEPDDDGPPA